MNLLRVWARRIAIACLLLGLTLPVAADTGEEQNATAQMGAAAGVHRYRPGSWGVVAVDAVNPTDEAAEILAVVYFTDDPTLQYGRKIWIPGKSILRSTCPIRIPDAIDPDRDYLSVVSVPVNQEDGTDKLGFSHAELIDRAKPLIVDHDPITVGILGDFATPFPAGDGSLSYKGPDPVIPAPDDPVYDVVAAAKHSQGLSRRISYLNAWQLPSDGAALDALDALVLSSNRLADDPDGTALVREWVLRGGYLWVMLEEVDQDAISTILGEAFRSTIVDRVGLTELRIEDERQDIQHEESVTLASDEPIAFARVIPRGVTVTNSIDGWPASFWHSLGAGKVFYTTVGPAAWIRPTMPEDTAPGDRSQPPPYVARGPLRRFAEQFFSKQEVSPIDVAAVQPFLAKQIGYRILRREIVAALLAVFCVSLAASGLWFWRTRRLDRLLWVAPSLAVVTSFVFLGVALTARRSVPPTVASWQRLILEPGLGTGRSRGLAALFSPVSYGSGMGATRGGMFEPDMTALRGERRRMVWTDEGAWHWEELNLPPGVRNAPMECTVSFDEAIDCRARFGKSGLQGRLVPTPFKGLADAVIVVPGAPVVAANIREDGSFTCELGDELAPGEFLADKLLTDVQQRRQTLYRQLLGGRKEHASYDRPTLFFWADSVDTGFRFPQATQLESALISIPVRFERSAVGSDVVIPGTFIPFRNVVGPDGTRSGAYSPITGEWGELKTPADEWLRFQVPESVLPIELRQAAVLLSIRAPSRSVEIEAVSEGSPVVVRKLVHPIGSFRIVLDRPEWLHLDEAGGVTVGIRVGPDESADPENVMAQASWLVESLQLEVAGTIQGE